jgi:PAS domain S-box-containing protein
MADDHEARRGRGTPASAVATTERDITERKRAEAALRRLATVLQDSNDAITMQDLEGRILAWNRGAERMYGYSEHEALQMNIEALVPEEERERARGFLQAIKRGEEVTSLEVKRRTKDGIVLDVWLTTTKLVDDEGRPSAVATTERDITDLKRAERERERLLKELGDAMEARDEFLSVASHELRNPLNALNLKLDLILKQARNAGPAGEKLASGIEVALRQSGRLTRLIDELLDVSRITSGRLTLEREDVNLSQLVPEVEDRLRQMVERGGTTVELRVQPGVVGRWDRLRLEQVLVNLLTNAVKYGGRSPIEISLQADERQATLAVRDRGPGIPEAEQQRIFERFARAAPRGVGGMGLGLYITRQIVEAHGGRIRIESQPGQGATFLVELPIRPASEVQSG